MEKTTKTTDTPYTDRRKQYIKELKAELKTLDPNSERASDIRDSLAELSD